MGRVIGHLEGQAVQEVLLVSDAGVEVAILSYGALIRDWRVPVGSTKRSVVLGFDAFEPYLTQSPYFGAICGRVGNRIGGAQFTLDGTHYGLAPNEGNNHLHGGPAGFALKNWTIVEASATSVTLTLESPDGEMGYPGALKVSVTYRLQGHALSVAFAATTDRPTPINMVQHNYFNLMGEGDVLDHQLWLSGAAVTELGAGQIPTGAILPVAETELDFTEPRTMRGGGGEPVRLDVNYALATRRDIEAPVARLVAPDGSLVLTIKTDQPGLQVYNGWKIQEGTIGLGAQHYGPFSGLCLEDQIFPDAVNHPHFPDPIVVPERGYHHWCEIEIKP